MTAERGRAAALDSSQHPKMLPSQSGSVLLDEVFARCSNDVGHLEGWCVHLLCSLRERFTCFGSENSALSMGVPAAFRDVPKDARKWRSVPPKYSESSAMIEVDQVLSAPVVGPSTPGVAAMCAVLLV